MLRIAICDDEKILAQQIESIIREIEMDSQIDIYEGGLELINSGSVYDVIFLDVDMPIVNGIDTAKAVRKHDKQVRIVYVTSYAEYMHYAFGVHAFAYLMKPVTREVIAKQLKDIFDYQVEEQLVERIRLETLEGFEEYAIQDIYYFEYMGRKVKVVTNSGICFIRKGIHAVLQEMEEYGFAMPHKSFVTNLYQVKHIKGYSIMMMNEDLLPLSQKKSADFRRKLSAFHGSRI